MGLFRVFKNLMSVGGAEAVVRCAFLPDGTDDPPISAGSHAFSVVYTSTGLYTVTFTHKLLGVPVFLPGIRVADGTPTIVQFGDYSAANRTLQVRVLQETETVGGDANTSFQLVDLTADADNEVSFLAIFKTDDVQDGS